MKTRKKLMFLAILIFLLSASVSSAYAYWAGTVNAPVEESDTISINIGEGGTVTTEIVLMGSPNFTNKVLVPTGQVANSVDPGAGKENVDVLYFCYEPKWVQTGGGNGVGEYGYLSVKINSITIGGDDTYSYLVNIYNGSALDTNPPQISVGWTGVTGATGTLNVATGAIKIDSSETYAGLVNVTITNASTAITTGTNVTVTVEVTLTEPADQDAYTAIAGKAIAIPLTFNVEPNNVEPN